MFDTITFVDLVGVAGSLVICTAYWLVSRGRLDAQAYPYNLMNLGGSMLLLVSLYFRPNPGAILIEVLWAAIALMALAGLIRKRK